ncbi:TetR/AcrR family transcriptional regulator [Mycobacterium yunnanensis]|uniref:TetR/AcrR family transcriptional regulator n=1 Tax=Mycobacterium yunnanensis TaxID=368477 RepID=A0A9X2YWJ0_9MYCO|nr:TetR/AcrR family transcriptional regulator [Mycobacterium yunnanensis]MCV7419838.1 TetR/AcrR family transcriptional regulator [Mycobacterium yunnanensis]
MAGDWLADSRTEVAADRILDAAEHLFTRHGAANVAMADVATAAGCSRATLYRYFENRDALYTAYVHRETHRVFRDVGDRVSGVADTGRRLVEAVLAALAMVRDSPALASWFAPSQRPIGGEMAERSEVITTLTAAFLRTLDVDDADRRARWLVRTMVSLLTFPGGDEDDERAMLYEFVVPVVLPRRATSALSSPDAAARPTER